MNDIKEREQDSLSNHNYTNILSYLCACDFKGLLPLNLTRQADLTSAARLNIIAYIQLSLIVFDEE